jgi:hypothetical protein
MSPARRPKYHSFAAHAQPQNRRSINPGGTDIELLSRSRSQPFPDFRRHQSAQEIFGVQRTGFVNSLIDSNIEPKVLEAHSRRDRIELLTYRQEGVPSERTKDLFTLMYGLFDGDFCRR